MQTVQSSIAGEAKNMELISGTVLVLGIILSDEVLNGQLKLAQKLLKWFENH